MANGDLAAAKGMAVVSGDADRRMGYDEINLTRDYVAMEIDNRNAADATKAAATHKHVSADITDAAGAPTPYTLMKRDASGRSSIATPTSGEHVVNKSYCDGNAGGSSLANGPTSTAYSRNATGSGWYEVWMNSSNQFMRNTSSKRYKEAIEALGVVGLAEVLALEVVTYHRKGQPAGTRELGLIAEHAVDVPHLVSWDVPRDKRGEPIPGKPARPEAIRYGTVLPVYLLAIVQQQQQQLEALAARVAALEGRGQ